MKLTLRIGAAVGIVALSACSQSPDSSANAESTAEAPADSGNATEETGPTDTLGNQLNQLNETGTDETEASNSE